MPAEQKDDKNPPPEQSVAPENAETGASDDVVLQKLRNALLEDTAKRTQILERLQKDYGLERVQKLMEQVNEEQKQKRIKNKEEETRQAAQKTVQPKAVKEESTLSRDLRERVLAYLIEREMKKGNEPIEATRSREQEMSAIRNECMRQWRERGVPNPADMWEKMYKQLLEQAIGKAGMAKREEALQRPPQMESKGTKEKKETVEGIPELPEGIPLIDLLQREAQKGKTALDALIAKLKGTRVYRYTGGKRESITVEVNQKENGKWEAVLVTKNEDGTEKDRKPLSPTTKVRIWSKPQEKQLPKKGDKVIYRNSESGEVVRATCTRKGDTYVLSYKAKDEKNYTSELTAEEFRRCTDKDGNNPAFTRKQPERPVPGEAPVPSNIEAATDSPEGEGAPEEEPEGASTERLAKQAIEKLSPEELRALRQYLGVDTRKEASEGGVDTSEKEQGGPEENEEEREEEEREEDEEDEVKDEKKTKKPSRLKRLGTNIVSGLGAAWRWVRGGPVRKGAGEIGAGAGVGTLINPGLGTLIGAGVGTLPTVWRGAKWIWNKWKNRPKKTRTENEEDDDEEATNDTPQPTRPASPRSRAPRPRAAAGRSEKADEEPKYAWLDLDAKGQRSLDELRKLQMKRVACKAKDGYNYYGTLTSPVEPIRRANGKLYVRFVADQREDAKGKSEETDKTIWVPLPEEERVQEQTSPPSAAPAEQLDPNKVTVEDDEASQVDSNEDASLLQFYYELKTEDFTEEKLRSLAGKRVMLQTKNGILCGQLPHDNSFVIEAPKTPGGAKTVKLTACAQKTNKGVTRIQDFRIGISEKTVLPAESAAAPKKTPLSPNWLKEEFPILKAQIDLLMKETDLNPPEGFDTHPKITGAMTAIENACKEDPSIAMFLWRRLKHPEIKDTKWAKVLGPKLESFAKKNFKRLEQFQLTSTNVDDYKGKYVLVPTEDLLDEDGKSTGKITDLTGKASTVEVVNGKNMLIVENASYTLNGQRVTGKRMGLEIDRQQS